MHTGCVGFPVGQDRYWQTLSFIEARTGEVMPKLTTLQDWKAGAPKTAQFSIQAYRVITHSQADRGFPPAVKKTFSLRQKEHCGNFIESLEVHEAWIATKAAAQALSANFIIFETPSTFTPEANRLRNFYRFFKNLSRSGLVFIWHPKCREWNEKIADRVCADLGLIRAFDPLKEAAPQKGAISYMRPQGPRQGSLSSEDVAKIKAAGAQKPSYLALSHRQNWFDSQQFAGG